MRSSTGLTRYGTEGSEGKAAMENIEKGGHQNIADEEAVNEGLNELEVSH